MALADSLDQEVFGEIGGRLYQFATDLYPICRSITGDGIRQTLSMIGERIPLKLCEVPTGTRVFDWIVPKEWNIRDAYIKDSGGKRVVDFQKSNLHIVNYSNPVHAPMRLAELRPHLFTIPEHPDWIPYKTSYYKDEWGFCLSDNQLQAMHDGEYDVCIDSTMKDGHLTYGEYFVAGELSDEVLISCHVCHPSLADDNLSGVAVATYLAQLLTGRPMRYSYRFLFAPGTIGAITWLARNEATARRIRHGLVLSCIGDAAAFHYKKSRRGNSEIDRVVMHVLSHLTKAPQILEFSPYGYDERQYCSPGFDLAVGCLMRSVWGTFPEYHTSADNLNFIKPNCLAESLHVCASIIDVLEGNRRYQNLNPFCEPQLGRRGLYRSSGGGAIEAEIHARLWILNLSDGNHSLLDIAERSKLPFRQICTAADLLRETGLLSAVRETESQRGL